jgi:predicted ester cyclase
MSTESTRTLVQRYQDALNTGDIDLLDEIMADDVRLPTMMPGFTGRDGAMQLARLTLATWPDCHVIIADGDQAVARLTITGTAEHDLLGVIPGTGRSFRVSGAYHVRVRDARIVEHVGIEDSLALMAQIQGQA